MSLSIQHPPKTYAKQIIMNMTTTEMESRLVLMSVYLVSSSVKMKVRVRDMRRTSSRAVQLAMSRKVDTRWLHRMCRSLRLLSYNE